MAANNIVVIDTDPATSKKKRKGKLHDDLEEMMFGFGDAQWPPNTEAVELLESIVSNYVQDLTRRAIQVSEITGKLDKECFMYLCRKDRRKFNRVHTLLTTNEELKRVQKCDIPNPDISSP